MTVRTRESLARLIALSYLPAVAILVLTGQAAAEEPAVPVVAMPASEAVSRTLAFARSVDGRSLPQVDEALAAIGEAESPEQRLSLVLRGLYAADGSVREVVDAAAAGDWAAAEQATATLPGDPFASTNVRTFLARTLIAMDAYDEAATVLEPADANAAVDPATLLFLRAVCEHAALDKGAGLQTIARLLAPGSEVSERHVALARLMRQDLEDLADNELNKLSKQMRSVQRKLRQGKSGEKTQGEEQQIVEGLDQMIEGLEQQLQAAQGIGQPGFQPDQPADEGSVGGPKGPGEVDRRPVGQTPGWGNLPEKQRTEARNLIENQFPPHYRRAVEEYFKKLAERE